MANRHSRPRLATAFRRFAHNVAAEARPLPEATSKSILYRLAGHFPELYEPMLAGKSYHSMHRALQKEGGTAEVLAVTGPGLYIALTSNPSMIREVNNRRDVFLAPNEMMDAFGSYSQGLVATDGPLWARHRRVAQRAFQDSNLKMTLATADAVVSRWLTAVAAKGGPITFDAEHTMRCLMLDIMGRGLLSVDFGGVDTLLGQAGKGSGASELNLLPAIDTIFKGVYERMSWKKPMWSLMIPKARRVAYQQAVDTVRSFVTSHVDRKIRERAQGKTQAVGSKDLLDHLLDAAEDPHAVSEEAAAAAKAGCPVHAGAGAQAGSTGSSGPVLTRDEVVDIAMDAVAGALDTSSITLSTLLYSMGLDSLGRLHPDIMRLDRHLTYPGGWGENGWVKEAVPRIADLMQAHPQSTSQPGRVWGRIHEEVSRVLGPTLTPGQPIPWDSIKAGQFPYIEATIKETLRLYNTFASTGRSAAVDTTLGNGQYRVPKGAMIVPLHMAMHTSAKYFPRPWEYVPERWLEGASSDIAPHPEGTAPVFNGFGGGPKGCVGRRMAMVQMTALVARMSQAWSRVELDVAGGQTAADITYSLSGKFRTPVRMTAAVRQMQ